MKSEKEIREILNKKNNTLQFLTRNRELAYEKQREEKLIIEIKLLERILEEN